MIYEIITEILSAMLYFGCGFVCGVATYMAILHALKLYDLRKEQK